MWGCYREIRTMSTMRYVAYTVFTVNVLTVLDVSMNMAGTASEGCVKIYACRRRFRGLVP